MEIRKIPYLDGGRELCVTGSCLLTASEDFIGDAIRLFEGDGAFVSHAAAVVRFPSSLVSVERVTLIESLEHGPTPTYLSHYFTGFTGRLFLFTPDGLTPEIQAGFAAWALDKALKRVKYGYYAIAEQTLGHVQEENPNVEIFCSDFVAQDWEANGINRLTSFPPTLAAQPSDIPRWWSGSVVELVGPFVADA